MFLSLLCRLGTVFAVKSKSRVQRVVALWGHVHKSPEQVCTLHESGFHDVGPHLRTSSEALVPYPDPSFVFISYGSRGILLASRSKDDDHYKVDKRDMSHVDSICQIFRQRQVVCVCDPIQDS
jgi:hypothetical protein